jgi:hypothetical protein
MPALLDEAIDALDEVDPAALSDAQLHTIVIENMRAASRFAAARARYESEWDRRRLWADDGSKAAWGRLARECALNSATAKAEVGRARKLRTMPVTREALAEGKLSVDQADALAHANQPDIAHLFAEEEAMLIGDVASVRVPEAQRRIAQWIDEAFERIGRDRGDRGIDNRTLYATRIFGGVVDLKGSLEPMGGTEFLNELKRLEQQMFEADWAAARAEHGPDALPSHLPRTAPQRRHDALIEMARRSRALVPGTQHPRPLITVLAGYGAFSRMCQLADGTPVSPGQVIPYLADADIERIVFDGPSRVIDVGVRRRFFSGALRRAIEVRDRHCQHPSGCDVPAEDCQVDHETRYREGGLTTQENGRCYCKTHNLQRENNPEYDDPHQRPPPEDDTS